MGFWDDFNQALKSNPVTRSISALGEATYNVIPKSDNLAIGTYESGTPTPIPNPDPDKSPFENYKDGFADNTVEKIPGWDPDKGITENAKSAASNGVKVVTDAFSNGFKAASELGSSAVNGLKKYAPLALAGGLAILLLRK